MQSNSSWCTSMCPALPWRVGVWNDMNWLWGKQPSPPPESIIELPYKANNILCLLCSGISKHAFMYHVYILCKYKCTYSIHSSKSESSSMIFFTHAIFHSNYLIFRAVQVIRWHCSGEQPSNRVVPGYLPIAEASCIYLCVSASV